MTTKLRSRIVFATFVGLIVSLASVLFVFAKEQSRKRLREADFYELIAVNPVPTVACEGDRIIIWNAAMEFMTGKSAHEVVGRKTIDIVPAEYAKEHSQAVEELSNGPGFARGSKFLILPTKTIFWGQQDILATASHLRRSDGSMVMVVRYEGVILHPRIRWLDVRSKSFKKVESQILPIGENEDKG